MALEGEVRLPGGAKVSKKAGAAGLVIVATLIGVYYWKKRSSGSSATAAAGAAATTTDQYPPDGTTGDPTDPYSTDLATGQTYGDEAAGAGTYGAYGADAASGMYYDPATGAYDLTSPYGTQPTGDGTGGPPFSSNSAWSNWVVQQEQTLNPDVNTSNLINALGVYLEGAPAIAAQKTLIMDARALAGDPPVRGANGYPPNVRTSGNGGGTTEVVPGVTGKSGNEADAALKAAHLVARFSPVRKAGKDYTVTAQSPAAGKRVAENSTVTLTVKEKPGTGGLKKETKVKVPVTYGDTADAALAKMKFAGLNAKITPQRQKGFSYWSYGSVPKGGTEVDKGSTVTITVAEGKPGTNLP